MRARRAWAAVAVAAVLGALAILSTQAASIAAGALLHPAPVPTRVPPPGGCERVRFAGDGVNLEGWRCAASGARRGAIVYLHGVADNRGSGQGVVSPANPSGQLPVISGPSEARLAGRERGRAL